MNNRFAHIITTVLLGIILVTLTVAKASAQIVVDQCDTMTFEVVSRPSIPETHFVWAIYEPEADSTTDVLDPALSLDPALYFVDGQYAGRKVQVTRLDPGTYYVRIHVWDEVTCTDNIEMWVMEVTENIPELTLTGDSMCVDEQPPSVHIVFSGTGPYNIQYSYDDGNTIVNLNGIVDEEITIPITEPLPVGETTFWVIQVENDCKAYEYPIDERPRTGIMIYPMPTKERIYLKDGD